MPIVDHNAMPEVPWRPGYRTWDIAGPANGMSTTLTYAVAEFGTGAPLHQHEDEELIVVLEGAVEARLGDEVRTVGADHTLAIPARPHDNWQQPLLVLRTNGRRAKMPCQYAGFAEPESGEAEDP